MTESFSYLSPLGYVVQYTILFTSSWLSIVGSSCIIYLVLFERQKRLYSSLYGRLLLGMSICDVFSSLSFATVPFLTRDDLELPLAFGNATTCKIVGFFFQFYMSNSWYMAGLALYFLWTVRYNWSEEKSSKFLEPWVHIGAASVALSLGISGVVLDAIHPSLVFGNCIWKPCLSPACEQGETFNLVSIFMAVNNTLGAVIGYPCTWLVHRSVKHREQMGRRFSFAGDRNEQLERRLRSVTTQAVLYTLAFTPGILIAILYTLVVKSIYGGQLESTAELSQNYFVIFVVFLAYATMPLQGFLNFIIFTRAKSLGWKKRYPQKTWLWRIRQILALRQLSEPNDPGQTDTPKERGTQRVAVREPSDPTSDPKTDDERLEPL